MTDGLLSARTPRDDEVDVYGVSHTGKVRKDNQDHYLIATFHRQINVVSSNVSGIETHFGASDQRVAFVAVVADGVGGGVGGAEASATALEAVMDYVQGSVTAYYGANAKEAEFKELLQEAAMRAHEAVRERRSAKDVRGTMATTMTLYFGVWPTYYLLQVGDSRYYVLRDGVLRQVTRDQTMAQDLVDQGAMTPDVAARTPMAHVLSSALGADTTIPVVTRMESHWDNVHLLCSDGLTKHVSDARIGEVLGSMTSAKQAVEQLLQDALDGGGTDNITILVARTKPKEAA
ncbi:MAG: protein phosphatase 2C domain-containing protein [Gemmatimonadota bacterium]|nr:protein phosphatase 2C domain-containing protein [Gemmatimonadota bacterium]